MLRQAVAGLWHPKAILNSKFSFLFEMRRPLSFTITHFDSSGSSIVEQSATTTIPPSPTAATGSFQTFVEPFRFTGIPDRVIPKLSKEEHLPTSSHSSSPHRDIVRQKNVWIHARITCMPSCLGAFIFIFYFAGVFQLKRIMPRTWVRYVGFLSRQRIRL